MQEMRIIQHSFHLVPFSWWNLSVNTYNEVQLCLQEYLESEHPAVQWGLEVNSIIAFFPVTADGEHHYMDPMPLLQHLIKEVLSQNDIDLHEYSFKEIHNQAGNMYIITIHSIEP